MPSGIEPGGVGFWLNAVGFGLGLGLGNTDHYTFTIVTRVMFRVRIMVQFRMMVMLG